MIGVQSHYLVQGQKVLRFTVLNML